MPNQARPCKDCIRKEAGGSVALLLTLGICALASVHLNDPIAFPGGLLSTGLPFWAQRLTPFLGTKHQMPYPINNMGSVGG